MCDSIPETGLCGIFNNYFLRIEIETKLLDKKFKQILIRFNKYKFNNITR